MYREATLATALVAALLTGCIAAPEEVETAALEAATPLLAELGALPLLGPTSVEDTYAFHVAATPEGATSAFWWTIPEGALIEDPDWDTKYLLFTAAPALSVDETATLERWAILAFVEDDGALEPAGAYYGAPFQATMRGLAGDDESIDAPAQTEPFWFEVYGDKLAAGDKVGLVVAAVTSEPAEVAFVLAPTNEEPDDWSDIPDETSEFLDLIEARDMAAPTAVGHGGAHQVAFFGDFEGLFGGGTIIAGPVTVEDDAPLDTPAGRMRRMTVSAAFDSGGFGMGAVVYGGFVIAGQWSSLVDAHGVVAESSGPVLPIGPPVAGDAPFAFAIGDGEAPSSTMLSVEAAGSPTGDGVFLLQGDLDTSLEDLLGLPSVSEAWPEAGGGATVEHGALALRLPGGARVAFPGMAP